MTDIDRRAVAKILARIKTYHSPQDIGETVITSWVDAFTYANVTNVQDAEAAVIRHYTTPGANPWITPGDVVGHYRSIRGVRLEGVDHGDITKDVDPNDIPAYLATLRYRRKAIANGMTVVQANALPLPSEARHALVDRRVRPIILAREE